MSSRKRIGFIAGAGVGGAAAAALRRRRERRGGSSPEAAAPGPAGEGFLEHLAEAIRIPTVSYQDRTQIDRSQFDRFGAFLRAAYPLTFEHLEVETPAGHSLLLRWEGTDPDVPPILLMAHIDVVPVEEGTDSAWPHDPFGGARDGEYLWGRGAIDDKGPLVAIFEAVEGLVKSGFRPDATLYLAVGDDEEIGGAEGAAVIAGILAERGVHFEFVLDEGGAVVEDFLPGAAGAIALLGVGEKGSVDVEITAAGTGGHSSMPPPQTAVGRLAAAVALLEEHPMPARPDVQAGLFHVLGRMMPGLRGMMLRRADRLGRLAERRLSAERQTNALIRTTGAATVIEGGVKPNVLPQQARAVVNYRILPGDTVDGVLEHVRSVVGDSVEVRPLEGGFAGDPPPVSETSSAAYRLVAGTIEDVFTDAVAAPWILMAATDGRHFARIADGVFRFAPFRLTPADMERIHGNGERVRVSDAERAVGFYSRLIRRACGTL
jgi:carboxypeptidase PM20D1